MSGKRTPVIKSTYVHVYGRLDKIFFHWLGSVARDGIPIEFEIVLVEFAGERTPLGLV